jgi:hypothetical protein
MARADGVGDALSPRLGQQSVEFLGDVSRAFVALVPEAGNRNDIALMFQDETREPGHDRIRGSQRYRFAPIYNRPPHRMRVSSRRERPSDSNRVENCIRAMRNRVEPVHGLSHPAVGTGPARARRVDGELRGRRKSSMGTADGVDRVRRLNTPIGASLLTCARRVSTAPSVDDRRRPPWGMGEPASLRCGRAFSVAFSASPFQRRLFSVAFSASPLSVLLSVASHRRRDTNSHSTTPPAAIASHAGAPICRA